MTPLEPLFGGIDIYVTADHRKRVPYPRSPARARRRALKGHPQHHRWVPDEKTYRVGNKLYMHPVTYAALRVRALEASDDHNFQAAIRRSRGGDPTPWRDPEEP